MIPLLAEPNDPVVQGLDVYVVGGAVRDAILGQPAGDRDWVVVGASPESMADRGFLPVGGDFPVFLHPHTKEEYALARTERKSGRGYRGFTFYAGSDVSLEDDLQRRDLTINAIAQAPDGSLVDPFRGTQDIEDKVLRHVGVAFCEDPVRLLRLARFAARFPQFSIATETLQVARQLVSNGEVDALVPERVWRELEKSLKTGRADRFLEVMAEVDALSRVLPGLTVDSQVAGALRLAAEKHLPLAGRFALLCHRSADAAAIAAHIRAPGECRDQAVLLATVLAAFPASTPQDWLDLIERCDGLRKPARFLEVLQAAACVAPVDLPAWQQRLDAVRGIDAGAVARTASGGDAIRLALRQARLEVLSR